MPEGKESISESSDSWTIVSELTAEKEMDRSTVKHRQTGVPIPLREFFRVDHVEGKFHMNLELVFEGVTHKGSLRFVRDKAEQWRSRLSWRKSLDDVIKERFPREYKSFAIGNDPIYRPTMVFERDKENAKRYFISFKDAIAAEPPLSSAYLTVIEAGYFVTADDIAARSGQNRIKGIHYIEDEFGRCVVILCTIGGENYPNKWLDASHVRLKYYLEGREDKASGTKTYNPSIKSNRAIINAGDEKYPIHVFSRSESGVPYRYEGIYQLDKVAGEETDMFFELSRVDTSRVESRVEVLERLDAPNDSPAVKEGKRRWRKHLSIERDSGIIKEAKLQAKQRYGKLVCEVCEFDFFESYGPHGEDFIEGHHKVPLHELGPDGGTTTVEDIALLCSNCHRMIHHKKQWLKVEELKAIYRSRKS